MANIRFFADNLWTLAQGSIAATSAAPALPAAASQSGDRTYVWRGLSQLGDQSLTRDLGAARTISAAALANVRALNGGAVLFEQAGSGASPGAWVTVATMPTQDATRRVTWSVFEPFSARHVRFRFENPVGVADFPEVGYAFVGVPLEPSLNVTVPMEWWDEDPSVIEKSVDGQATLTERTMYIGGECSFTALPQSDFDAFRLMYRSTGIRRPIFMVLDDVLPWSAPLMRLTSPIRHTWLENSQRYDVTFSWEEIR